MAHLDPNSGSGATVAAASHSHVVVDMPQLDASSHSTASYDDKSGHVVIDIESEGRSGTTGSDIILSCVVCTEPLEWVAVGPCGHRAVCSMCVARVRAGPGRRQTVLHLPDALLHRGRHQGGDGR
ncbi:hypothetical protein OsJ_02273 [Oryza sativa Japonica Group]|uniref:RING-type domain-containing protein n=1 Tax=Oryza sativa subsp. japonica TaxID=39947 RepID=B9EXL6_ORYSJ|nr:hypothetical protein OsJ_02273 [Oryza sativa Japonica Group]